MCTVKTYSSSSSGRASSGVYFPPPLYSTPYFFGEVLHFFFLFHRLRTFSVGLSTNSCTFCFEKFLFKAEALRLTSIPSHSGWKANGIHPNAENPLSYLLLLFFMNTARSQLTVSLCIANFLHFILEFCLQMHSFLYFMWYRTLTRISSRFSCPCANDCSVLQRRQ